MTEDKVSPDSPDAQKRTGEDRLPGDLTREQMVERMLRVDHAGEYGAVRIYAGQLAVLGRDGAGRKGVGQSGVAPVIREMAEAENKHLETFDKLLVERHVRPTLMAPFWYVAGFALGAGSALMGPRAAMACTAAVEEVIEEHYASQVEQLGDDEAELRFYFSWTGLQPFSKALARENLEVREVQQRRRRFKKVEEIGRRQQEHDELLRGAMKKLGGGAVA